MSNELVLFNSINTPYDFHKRACSLPVLSETEERALLRNCQEFPEDSSIYQSSSQSIILHHLRVVSKIALKVANTINEFKEIISEGIYGLIDAIKHFDLNKPSRFVTYAVWWIKYRVGEWLKKKSVVSNCNNVVSIDAPLTSSDDDVDFTYGDIIADQHNDIDTYEEEDSRKKQAALLYQALQTLTDRNREIVLRYNNGQTLQEIGDLFNISRERVRQIYNRSIEKLKQYFDEKNINMKEI